MNQLIIVAIIIGGLVLIKFIVQKFLELSGKLFQETAKSTGKIFIFIGMILLILVFISPEKTMEIFNQLQDFLQNLIASGASDFDE